MRLRSKRRLSVTAGACLVWASLWLGSCSSQQEDSDVTATEDAGQGDEVVNENVGDDGQGAADKKEGEDVAATEEGAAVAENTAAAPEGQNSTEGDLKEIISEMNSNTAEAAGDPEAALAQQNPQPANAAPAPAAEAAPAAAAPAAAPAQVAVGLPEMGSKMPYIVEHGDTLGKIAQKIYGNQGRWKDIANLSTIANPSRIYPGDVVYYALDESSLTFAKAYEGVPRSKETVQPGDTLAKIAQRVYGTSRSWKHIWRQNDNIDNPDKLTSGATVFYVQKGALSAELKKVKETIKNIVDVQKKEMKSAKKLAKSKITKTSNQSNEAFAQLINLSLNVVELI